MVMYYYTNKVLSDDGIVVTLAGDMGDEVLGGYPKYWKLRQRVLPHGRALWKHG